MNILGKKQEKIFEKGISEKEYEKRLKHFLELYYQLRSEDSNKWWNKLSLTQRQKIHNLILGVYEIKNKIGGFSYQVIADKRENTNRPKIFAPTHIGKFDIENISKAIKEHYCLLSGDYEHLQGTIDAIFLGLNGVFYFNEKVASDRKDVTKKMIDYLKENGNLLYFIEGTWNLTPNLPVLPCYWGIIDIARATNAIIIPIGVEQYDKLFKINIGNNFDVNNYGLEVEEKHRAIKDLRDCLATLKWEIWDTVHISRCNLDGFDWQDNINLRFSEWPGFNKEYISSLIYRPKDVVTQLEAFENISKINLQDDKSTADEYALKLKLVSDAKNRVFEYQKNHF